MPIDAKPVLRIGGRLLAELLVVFVGVSAAFMVEHHRDQMEDQQRLEQAYAGFVTELQNHVDREREHAANVRKALADYTAVRTAGEYPPPAYYRIPGSEFPPETMWQTTVASGVINRIPMQLRLDLGYFYEENRGIAARYVRYAKFLESDLLPGMKARTDVFHDPKTHLLYPRYSAGMDRLLEFANYFDRQADMAEKLIARIHAEQTPDYD